MSGGFVLPLPAKIVDDPGARLLSKNSHDSDEESDTEISVSPDCLQKWIDEHKRSRESQKCRKESKLEAQQRRRLDNILTYQAESSKESFWSSMKLPLELSTSDTYVSFGPQQLDSGALACSKASDLALTEEQRKVLDQTVAGDKKLEIKPKLGKKALKKAKKAEREKTKGDNWFGMKAPEMTEETKRDLEVLQMRSVVDPKRFYKKNDMKVLPKYFQIGHVIDSPADFYNGRATKKSSKKTLVDELMADAEFRKFNKRKYAEIIEEKSKYQRKKRHVAAKKKKKAAA